MDPKDKKSCIQALIYLVALTFPLLILGIVMIGRTIFYLDCSRISGTVNCMITTRFLGTFITEKFTASGVTRAIEIKDCEEDNCHHHIELATSYGRSTFFIDDFLNESKAKEVNQINAYLEDASQQALHTKVIYWRLFILSSVYIFIGVVGLFLLLFLGIYLNRVKTEWRAVVQMPKSTVGKILRRELEPVMNFRGHEQ